MKTKLNLSLLAAAAMLSSNVASAQTPGAPQHLPAGLQPLDMQILQLMTNGSVVGNTGADRLCGGMDDDQLHGNDGDDTITGDAGNDTLYGGNGADMLLAHLAPELSPDPAAWPVRLVNGVVITNPGDGGILTEKPTYGVVLTDPGDGGILIEKPSFIRNTMDDRVVYQFLTSVQYPYDLVAGPVVNHSIESDQFGINGDGGADVVAANARHSSANGITGSAGADSFTGDPMEEDALFEILAGIRGYAGADELWGDNGTDSLKK